MHLLLYFAVGFLACAVGALPFGAINLSVVSISIRKSYQDSIQFALGASLIEILEAFVAIFFGQYISQFLTEFSSIPYLISAVFIIFGLYFFIRKTSPKLNNTDPERNIFFFKGILVALVNPQAIPFWLFVIAFITPLGLVEFSGLTLLLFLVGVFLGKLVTLIGFANMSNYLEKRLGKSCDTIDYIMGSVFISIGAFQLFTHLPLTFN